MLSVSETRTCGRKGFSLVEAAIVLGIMAIILAAVWVTMSVVREKINQDDAKRQITAVVNNIRALYMGENRITDNFSVLTDELIKKGAILADMVRKPAVAPFVADHPWGRAQAAGADNCNGGFCVCDDTVANCAASSTGTGQSFRIRLRDLSLESCIGMALKISQQSGPPGLLGIEINGVLRDPAPANAPWPITLADAQANCASRTPANTTIDYIYRLRQQGQ